MSDEQALSFAGAVARRAEARPDDEVVRLAGTPGWSAAALWQRSLAIAGGLADLVEAGDAVATNLPPGPEAIAVTTAISALGAVEMPLSADAVDDSDSQPATADAGELIVGPRVESRCVGPACAVDDHRMCGEGRDHRIDREVCASATEGPHEE